MQHLRGLTKLEDLDVGYNKEITDIGIGCLKDLSNLKRLCVYYSKLTDSGMASLSGMTDLEYLEVHYTSVTPNGFVHLEPLKALKKLVVAKSFSDEEFSQIQAALPDCNIVRR